MKKYDKRMLFKIALGAGVLVHSSMLLLKILMFRGIEEIVTIEHAEIVPTYKMMVPSPKLKLNKLKMNESRAKETDAAPCYAKNEGVDTLSPTEE